MLILALGMPSQSHAALTFTPGATLTDYAGWSTDTVTADFNLDGRADVVVVNTNAGNFMSYLGNGSGGFTAVGPHFTAGPRPVKAAVGHFNGDAYPDLLISSLTVGNYWISVWTGNGDGSFTKRVDYPVPSASNGIAVADFNGDGRSDFAVPFMDSNQVRVYLGNGDSTFAPYPVAFTVGAQPADIVAADFNGDGDVDLAVANISGNSISILWGFGTGFFVPNAGASPAITSPHRLATGDFNEDGLPDLLASSTSGSNVYYLRGLGDGTFAITALAAGSASERFTVADFNLDGHADFAVPNYANDNITVRLGNGDGTFTAAANVTAGDGPMGIASADFNADGKPDLVVANQLANNARVFINAFTSPDSTLAALTTSAGALAPAFAPATHAYSVFVPNATASITITPTRHEVHATITVNGIPVASGTPSGAIALVVGANAIPVVVTAEDGSTQTYTVTVYRSALLSNANLIGLDLSSGTLSPGFSELTQWYTAYVANSVASITVTPTTPDWTFSSIQVNGTPVTSGTPSGAIALNVGLNPTIDILVTAENGTTTKTYHVDVTRGTVADDASLSALALSSGTPSPAFTPGTLGYTASVANGVASITVTPTVSAAGATVTVNGNPVASGSPSGAIALNVGANAIPIVVTSSSGNKSMTYTVTVDRAAAAATPPIVGNVPNLTAIVGSVFSQSLSGYVTQTEGDAILGYTLTGSLPAGLGFNAATGVLSGTPTATGFFINLTLTATDKDGVSNADTFSLTVNAVPVKSYTGPVANGAGNATASFSGGGANCTYIKSAFIPVNGGAGSPPAGSAPGGYVFPFGLFDFALGNCTPGSTVTLTIVYPQPIPAGAVYWKYGPTAGNIAPHWYPLPATLAGNTATFSITDGGLGDDDLIVNGTIVDQGGPGAPGAAGGITGIPTLGQWGLILLAVLLGLMGMSLARRRVE